MHFQVDGIAIKACIYFGGVHFNEGPIFCIAQGIALIRSASTDTEGRGENDMP